MSTELQTAEWELSRAKEKVIIAALEVAQCDRIGAETAGDSFQLDMAYDELDDRLEEWAKATEKVDKLSALPALYDELARIQRDSPPFGLSYSPPLTVDPIWFLNKNTP